MQPKEIDLANYLVHLRQADPEIATEVDRVLGQPRRPKWSKDAASAMRCLLRTGPKPALEALNQGGGFEPFELETIVLRFGRPVIAIKQGEPAIDTTDVDSQTWVARLENEATKAALALVIPSVGRVEVSNHPSGLDYLGTGWVVDDGVIATNRHVALAFAERGAQGFQFSLGFDRKTPIGVSVDFLEEIGSAAERSFAIARVLFIAKDSEPDIAFLALAADGAGLPPKLALASEVVPDQTMVAVVGYPARDTRVPEQGLMDRIFGNVYDKKRLAPGLAGGLAGGNLLHDCTTLGGNSGSPVIDLRNGQVCGLHYSGVFLRSNYAVPAPVVEQFRSRAAAGEATGYVPNIPTVEPGAMTTSQPSAAPVQELKFTIPIEVTVRVGAPATATIATALPAPSVSVLAPAAGTQPTPDQLAQAVEAARQLLGARPDVVSIAAGWKFDRGWITDQRAVVVAVRQKLGEAALAARGLVALPREVLGVPVDVYTAPLTPEAVAVAMPETVSATWNSPYQRWPEKPLAAVEAKMRAIFHASPDAGWAQLHAFLDGTKKSLTIGMYDFTAPHIVAAVRGATKAAGRALSLVLQRGEDIGKGTKRDDVPDAQTVEELRAALGNRLQFAWAAVYGARPLFRNAYHIKVAVRDRAAFWLSSGNWQSSNQPVADPLAGADTAPPLLKSNNREWHAIVQNRKLAQLFEDYLLRDREQAAARGGEELPAAPEPLVWVPADYFQPTAAELEAPVRYFKPLVLDKKLRVQPLLTPDNYSPLVVELIESAEHSISFQNQSLKVRAPGQNPEHYEKLLQALLAKQQAGVKVRIVIRRIGDLRAIVSALKDYGFDMGSVRLQTNCHTKGIVVDGKAVLLGSQNWTGDGTGYNRDASLIVHDEEVAAYYQQLFDYDYSRIGPAHIDESLPTPELFTGAEAVNPPRMVLMPLERWLGEA